MFKRANKITSLLVAAAAIISIVPASAADVKKIDSEDGTIYNAVAYKDGKAYIDGEIDDDEAAYYIADGDYSELEDVDSGDDAVLFGEKYLDVEDGDYTVDLDDGSVTDDDITGDTADDAAGNLRKEIKDDTDDRYDEDTANDIKDEDELDVIPGARYSAPWYATTYTAASDSTTNGEAGSFNIYTDTDGNYIDADYNLGKVKVTTTTSGATKTESIENTDDNYDAAGTSDALRASVSQDKVLTQDADYIYRLATVTVTTTGSAAKISEINGQELSDDTAEIFTSKDDGQTVSFKAIQKISKEQDSDDIDGACYPKTVTTYALSDDDGSKLSNESLITDPDTQFTIGSNGKLIAYNTVDDEETVTANAYTLKSSSGYYYADEEDESEEDCEFNDDDGDGAAVQTDVNGNLWRLDGGYIYKFDNTDDWDKVYKVDGSVDELSVYDEDNMITWCEDDEVYSVIGGSSTEATTPDPTTTTTTTTGWVSTATGWTFYDATGAQTKGQWINDGGVWYMIKVDGIMATGWYNDNGTWYFLNTSGAMQTGWLNDNGTWYFLNASGAMQTGWLNDNGTWYYLNTSGAMLSNTTIDGYVLGTTGAWIK